MLWPVAKYESLICAKDLVSWARERLLYTCRESHTWVWFSYFIVGAASMILTPGLALGVPAIFLQVCNGDTHLWTSYQYFGQQTCGKELFQKKYLWEKKYFNNSDRCQQCHVENTPNQWDSKISLDVLGSPLQTAPVQHSVTNVHKLALTQRRWLDLLPGRLVCFLLKPVWIFLAALRGLIPRQFCQTSRKRLKKVQTS